MKETWVTYKIGVAERKGSQQRAAKASTDGKEFLTGPLQFKTNPRRARYQTYKPFLQAKPK